MLLETVLRSSGPRTSSVGSGRLGVGIAWALGVAVGSGGGVPVGAGVVTVMDDVPLWFSEVAVIVAVPAATAVTNPDCVTVAIESQREGGEARPKRPLQRR